MTTVDEVSDLIEQHIDDGVTDGLPIILPTGSRVRDMVAASGCDADEVVGIIPPRYEPVTVQDVAVNAVMAGCRPEYLPVVLTALRAMLEPEFHLEHLGTSTKGNAPLLFVNGPIRTRLAMNAGAGLLGPGNRANATIGRAVRLVMLNLGGSEPGVIDRAQFGHPGKYTYAFAEDEEGSPWAPFHVDLGHASESSTVTVVNAEAPRIFAAVSSDPDVIVDHIAAALSVVPSNGGDRTTEAVALLAPDHRGAFEAAGWSKAQVREAIWERTTKRVADLPSRHGRPKDADGNPLPDDAEVRLFLEPEHLKVVAAGGPGICGMVILGAPWLDYGVAITREIPNGIPPATPQVTDDQLADALQPVNEQLGADGYVLAASLRGAVLDAEVVAGPDACADCLVPQEIFSAVLSDRLAAAGIEVAEVTLRYPSS